MALNDCSFSLIVFALVLILLFAVILGLLGIIKFVLCLAVVFCINVSN